MASDKEYLEFVLEKCDGLSARPMMGEYLLYFDGKYVAGVFDNRLLVKPTATAKDMMPNAEYQVPYEGAKEMILVDNLDDKDFLKRLFEGVSQELPAPKKK